MGCGGYDAAMSTTRVPVVAATNDQPSARSRFAEKRPRQTASERAAVGSTAAGTLQPSPAESAAAEPPTEIARTKAAWSREGTRSPRERAPTRTVCTAKIEQPKAMAHVAKAAVAASG